MPSRWTSARVPRRAGPAPLALPRSKLRGKAPPSYSSTRATRMTATAITTAFDDDPLQETIYIGSLAVTSIVLNLTRVYLARHPMLHSESKDDLRRGLVTGWVITALFLVALAVALVVPVIGYSALFLLFLTQPISAFLVRRIGDA